MTMHNDLQTLWLQTRDRLAAKGLLEGARASLSIRCPGGSSYWVGLVSDAQPVLADWRRNIPTLHDSIYDARADVGAIAFGGGPFGTCLSDFGGALPQIFDEQARHLGPMSPAIIHAKHLSKALSKGGNALLWEGRPLILGTTCARMILNAELFEKCAKAYVAAAATGGCVSPLPWLVRHIANGRMRKDQRRAAEAFARGELPPESKGY